MVNFLAGGYKFIVEATAILTFVGLMIIIAAIFSGSSTYAGGASLLVAAGVILALFLVLGISAVLISMRDILKRQEVLLARMDERNVRSSTVL